MDSKIEVLNGLLDGVSGLLKGTGERIERLKVEKEKIGQELRYLYDYEDKLEKRRSVLQEIIEDERMKFSDIKTYISDGIIVGMDMGIGPDIAAMVKDGPSITSPLYGGESASIGTMISGDDEIYLAKIAKGAAEQIKKQIERNNKYGKV